MAKYRHALPQLKDDFFMTDGGIETTLIFLEGLELPYFAAFHLFKSEEGRQALKKYFQTYAALANRFAVGLVLETATWRANADWGARLDYDPKALAQANRESVRLLEEIRRQYENRHTPIVISGCIGPRGDGYLPGNTMTELEAEAYHDTQIQVFATTRVDLVTAITMNYVQEAIGIVRAAKGSNLPVVISFTVETDGNLPTGQTLAGAIQQVDAATQGYPAYFMINCAHPSHLERAITTDEPWVARVRGLRANASRMSHAQLNDAPTLDAGNPVELGQEYAGLRLHSLRHLNVMGGCCGTDERHIEQIATACVPLFHTNN